MVYPWQVSKQINQVLLILWLPIHRLKWMMTGRLPEDKESLSPQMLEYISCGTLPAVPSHHENLITNANTTFLNTELKGEEEMPRPLKYGQGSIKRRKEKRKDGSFRSWYQIRWRDETGRQITRTAKTYDEARAILSENYKRNEKQTRVYHKTFGEYMLEWYDTFRSAECCKQRNDSNLLQINRIPRNIMGSPLSKINANDMQAYLNTIEKPNPKMQTKELLSACIKHAFNSGQIKSNFGVLLKAEKPKAAEKPILPREREQEFLDLLPFEYRGYALGLTYTGARLGEFMSLNENWQTDIDYERKIIRIRETKSLRQEDIKAGTTYFIREVPLFPQFEQIQFPLKEVKQKTVNKNFAKAAKKFGINLTPHCMRHTFITRCEEFGISETASMSWSGHKNKKIHKGYKHKTQQIMSTATQKFIENTHIGTHIQSEKVEILVEPSPNLVPK